MKLLLASFKADPELNTVFSDSTWDELKTLTQAVLSIWKTSTEYQGFDAKALLVSLMNKHTVGNNSPLVSSRVEIDDNHSYTFTNHEAFMKDMTFLIMLFGNRGSNLAKIKTKTRDDVNVIIDFLIQKYNIIHRQRRPVTGFDQDLGKLSVTLARITACLPLTLCSLASQNMVRVLVNFSDLGDPNSQLSKALLVPHFSSAIPFAQAIGSHYVSFLVSVITDNIINTKTKTLTPLKQILTHYEASYRTAITTQAVRTAF